MSADQDLGQTVCGECDFASMDPLHRLPDFPPASTSLVVMADDLGGACMHRPQARGFLRWRWHWWSLRSVGLTDGCSPSSALVQFLHLSESWCSYLLK